MSLWGPVSVIHIVISQNTTDSYSRGHALLQKGYKEKWANGCGWWIQISRGFSWMKSQGSHLATNGNTFQCHVPEMLGKDSKLNIFIRGLSSRHFLHGHATMQESQNKRLGSPRTVMPIQTM